MIRDPDAYLRTAVATYRDDCAAGFSDVFAAKKALWRLAVCVHEIAGDDAGRWIDQLRPIALRQLKPGQVRSTLKSAASKASRG